MSRGFASDNNAGVHPDILKALETANTGHMPGYGDDPITQQAIAIFKQQFGTNTDVYFTFNGTGANVLALSSITQSYHSVICADTAHIQVDECGAPEKLTGCKLLPVTSINGKITPEGITKYLFGFNFEHHAQPRVISISQVTELGSVYTCDEIKAIANLAHQYGLLLHMDGARIANAAVALNLPFKSFTKDVGVDILSFGGTKNGMMMGEAVLFFNPKLSKNTKYIRKQNMQLFSKMRFVSTQFLAYFDNELWKKNALHANNMAKLLEQEVSCLSDITLSQPTEANGVFAIIPKKIITDLQKKYFFYVWDESKSEVRWMTSFDTQEEDVYGFIQTLKKLL